MLPMYYRRANAAIIVYDVTSQSSFDQVTEWITGSYDTWRLMCEWFVCFPELKKNIPNEVCK